MFQLPKKDFNKLTTVNICEMLQEIYVRYLHILAPFNFLYIAWLWSGRTETGSSLVTIYRYKINIVVSDGGLFSLVINRLQAQRDVLH
jgi:hypothetical protein